MEKQDTAFLEKITFEVIDSIDKGKKEIFHIAETARQEMLEVKESLHSIEQETQSIINQVDKTENLERKARVRLMEVSKNFSLENQDVIQKAYETAHKLQVDLILYRQKERTLKEKRNEQQLRLKNLLVTVDKAEQLITHVSVALDYLSTKLLDVSTHLEDYKQYKNMGYRIIEAQETERKRVARDIHDGPAQSLADITLNAEYIEKIMGADPVRARQELQDVKSKIRMTLQEIRRIIHQLRPMGLDDLGLIKTLQRYCEDFSERYGINTEFVALGSEKRFKSTTEVTLFRIVQESLQNIYKHSKAKNVLVKIEIENQIALVIKDDGIGFKPQLVLEDVNVEKYGLMGIKERVNLLEGDFQVKSEPGKGTIIAIRVPETIKGEN